MNWGIDTRIIGNAPFVLVDCFDTVIVRKVHPLAIQEIWAKNVTKVYPEIDAQELSSLRTQIIRDKNIQVDITGIYEVYDRIAGYYESRGISTEDDRNAFINKLMLLEVETEVSVQLPNSSVVKTLQRAKKNGAKVYCVSDYHFCADVIEHFFCKAGILDLFDGVFSSAEEHATKHCGELYEIVLRKLQVDSTNCVMIGDNRVSDVKNAELNGISGFHVHRKISRYWHSIQYRCGVYRKKAKSLEAYSKLIWKTTDDYEEYAVIFWLFCKRLYQEVHQLGGGKITFLAREGYFLRKCFETYQDLCVPDRYRIATDYLKCSRRAITSVQIDKFSTSNYGSISIRNYLKMLGFVDKEIEQLCFGQFDIDRIVDDFSHSSEADYINSTQTIQQAISSKYSESIAAFTKYVLSKCDGNSLYLVDVGWKGTMQQGIQMIFPEIVTKGYYIGVTEPIDFCGERSGLIFDYREKSKYAKRFDILRANSQLYEQFLAAPHGSACCYYETSNGNIDVLESWDDAEKDLYYEVLQDTQDRMLSRLKAICVSGFDEMEDEQLSELSAKIILRSCLLQSNERLAYMKRLSKGFSQNFLQQTVGLKYEPNTVKFSLIDILSHPQKYVRYFAKLGVVLDGKKVGFLRKPVNTLFYWINIVGLK